MCINNFMIIEKARKISAIITIIITNGAPKAREILGFYTRFLWFPYYLISIYLITWTPPRVGGRLLQLAN